MKSYTRDMLDDISDRCALRFSAEYDVIFPMAVCLRRFVYNGDEACVFCANRAILPDGKGVEC